MDAHLSTAEPNSKPRLAEIVACLSLATDVGMGHDMETGLSSCALATRLVESLGMSRNVTRTVYYLSLLHLIGCTADAVETSSIMGDELDFMRKISFVDYTNPRAIVGFMYRYSGEATSSLPERLQFLVNSIARAPKKIRQGARAHCEVGEMLADRLELDDELKTGLWHAHENWNGSGGPKGVKGEDISPASRVVQAAVMAALFQKDAGTDAAIEMLAARAGSYFDPEVAHYLAGHRDLLIEVAELSSPWEDVVEHEPEPHLVLGDAELDGALGAVADFADLKSLYTAANSRSVSELAATAAHACRLSEQDVDNVRRAGLLKDLGRVGVSTSIWDKAGPLSPPEWERVRLHPYYVERITARSDALRHYGRVASMHHERRDGSGYHRGSSVMELPPSALVLQAADCYVAMTSRRAHRAALEPGQAANHLRAEARSGRLDGEAVDAVLEAAGHRVAARGAIRLAGLTERELEVLDLVAQGFTVKQIARMLVIAPKTVDNHIQSIYSKSGVSTRAAATLFAMQNGIVGRTRR